MADRIKGITVQLGGDTTGLSKALSSVNKEISQTQKDLKDVQRLLKLDPSNTKLLAQEQKLLTKEISDTKAKLDTLKEAEKQVQVQFQQGKVSQEQYDALQREISDTESKLKTLKKAQSDFGSVAKQVLTDVGNKFKSVGDKLTGIGTKMSVVSAGIAGLFTKAVKTTMEFDSTMSQVKALMGATEEEFSQLREAALEAGAASVFSASDAAEALSYMALAGWDANQSMTALNGVLNLAATSGLSMAESSDIVTNYLNAFGLECGDAAYLADLMALAQSSSSTTTAELAEAYKNCAANMNAAGQDVETTTALLMAMANQGLKSSEAGTALAAVMRDITSKMDDGAIAIGNASVAVSDSAGNFRDLSDILADVETAVGGMGSAEAQSALQATFTSDSIRGLNMILQQGVTSCNGFETALRSCGGTAEEQAAVMNDNLAGKFEELNGQLETLQVTIGTALTPLIEQITEKITSVVEWLNSLDTTQQQMIVTLGLIVAAIGPLLVVLGVIAGSIGSIITLIGLIATPVGLVVAAVVAAGVAAASVAYLIITHLNEIKAVFDAVVSFVTSVWDAMCTSVSEAWSTWIANATQAFEDLKNGVKNIINGIIGFLNGMVSAAVSAVNTMIDAFNKISVDIPEWVPIFGGKKYSLNIPNVTAPQIPMLADGGTLRRGSAIVGEAGAELLTVTGGAARVTPLSGDRARAAGNNITINAQFSGYAEADARKLVRLVNRELGRVT